MPGGGGLHQDRGRDHDKRESSRWNSANNEYFTKSGVPLLHGYEDIHDVPAHHDDRGDRRSSSFHNRRISSSDASSGCYKEQLLLHFPPRVSGAGITNDKHRRSKQEIDNRANTKATIQTDLTMTTNDGGRPSFDDFDFDHSRSRISTKTRTTKGAGFDDDDRDVAFARNNYNEHLHVDQVKYQSSPCSTSQQDEITFDEDEFFYANNINAWNNQQENRRLENLNHQHSSSFNSNNVPCFPPPPAPMQPQHGGAPSWNNAAAVLPLTFQELGAQLHQTPGARREGAGAEQLDNIFDSAMQSLSCRQEHNNHDAERQHQQQSQFYYDQVLTCPLNGPPVSEATAGLMFSNRKGGKNKDNSTCGTTTSKGFYTLNLPHSYTAHSISTPNKGKYSAKKGGKNKGKGKGGKPHWKKKQYYHQNNSFHHNFYQGSGQNNSYSHKKGTSADYFSGSKQAAGNIEGKVLRGEEQTFKSSPCPRVFGTNDDDYKCVAGAA